MGCLKSVAGFALIAGAPAAGAFACASSDDPPPGTTLGDGGQLVRAPTAAVGCGAHPNAFFCDDFESPADFPLYWGRDVPELEPYENAEVAGAYSGARVVRSRPPGDAAGSSYRLRHTTTSVTGAKTLSFRLRVAEVPRSVVAMKVTFSAAQEGGQAASLAFTINIVETKIVTSYDAPGDGGRSVNHRDELGELRPNTWQLISIAFDVGPSPGFVASLDGVALAKVPIGKGAPIDPRFQLTLEPFGSVRSSTTMELDDVVFE